MSEGKWLQISRKSGYYQAIWPTQTEEKCKTTGKFICSCMSSITQDIKYCLETGAKISAFLCGFVQCDRVTMTVTFDAIWYWFDITSLILRLVIYQTAGGRGTRQEQPTWLLLLSTSVKKDNFLTWKTSKLSKTKHAANMQESNLESAGFVKSLLWLSSIWLHQQ